uniref:hypothetical protein n=2 Tax=Gelidibacter sp. TaxID=2018083 RepID=UPI00404B43EC
MIILLFCLSIACSNNGNDDQNLIEPESSVILNPLHSNDDTQFRGDSGTSVIVVDIGRASKDCKRIGICRFCLFCPTNPQPTDQELADTINDAIDDAQNDAQRLPHNSHIVIKLKEYLDPNIYDTNFYIDGDIYADDDNNYYLPSSSYPLELNIGDFGGYRIPIVKK